MAHVHLLARMLPTIKIRAKFHAGRAFRRVSADDLMQDAAEAVWRAILAAGDRTEDQVRRYCDQKATYTMVDSFRRELVQQSWTQGRGSDLVDADTAPSAESCAERRQLLAMACAVADQLPPRQKELIRRQYAQDHDQTEISVDWGVDPSRVSQVNRQALAAIRNALAERSP